MPSLPLTDHEYHILKFVRQYQSEHAKSPSYREIGAAVGIRSTDHVSRELHRLASRGLIRLATVPSRRIRLNLPMTSKARRRREIAGSPKPAPAPRPKRIPFRGFCVNCHIKSRTRLCKDCKGGAPIIQHHLLAGNDRFCLRSESATCTPNFRQTSQMAI